MPPTSVTPLSMQTFTPAEWAAAKLTDRPMDKLLIRGGRPLNGEVRISGAKNAACRNCAPPC